MYGDSNNNQGTRGVCLLLKLAHKPIKAIMKNGGFLLNIFFFPKFFRDLVWPYDFIFLPQAYDQACSYFDLSNNHIVFNKNKRTGWRLPKIMKNF